LPYPDENEKIVHAIVDLSDRIIVLTKKSQEILTSHYGCPIAKNPSNPHGNHSMGAKELKNKYELSNKIILSTFGLIEKQEY
jgi:hypothetical protein